MVKKKEKKERKHRLYKEDNLLSEYFSKYLSDGGECATFDIIGKIREYIQKGIKAYFPDGLINKSKKEIRKKTASIDKSTYHFQQDLIDCCGTDQKRVVLLVEGKFKKSKKDEGIESTIAIDLGNDPNELFGEGGKETIDQLVTDKKTREFLKDNRAVLNKESYTKFDAEKSRFLYFNEEDLLDKGFLGNKGLDVNDLARFITGTEYIGLEKNICPSEKKFMQKSPRSTSYRLKKSLIEKLIERLNTPRIIKKKDNIHIWDSEKYTFPIVDWVAHRLVVDTKEDAYNMEKFLKNSVNIGKSTIEYRYTTDYYKSPKKKGFSDEELTEDNAYRGLHVILKVKTPGEKQKCVREIQIVDKKQFYFNEIKEGSRLKHTRGLDRIEQMPKDTKKLSDHYEKTLTKMFGESTISFDIPKYNPK